MNTIIVSQTFVPYPCLLACDKPDIFGAAILAVTYPGSARHQVVSGRSMGFAR